MEISQKIKSYRNQHQLTQKDVAELLNVSDKTISSWERERTYPDLEMIIAISDLLDISVDNLLRGDDKVVKKITKDTQLGKKRVLVPLMIIVIAVLVLIVGLKGYERGMGVDRPHDIKSARFMTEKNGDTVVEIELDLPFYEAFSGYMGGHSDEGSHTAEVSIYTNFNFFNKPKQSHIKMPFIKDDPWSEDITKVLIKNPKGGIVRTIEK